MGSLIEKGRPPVAACGECPHCPTPEVEDYTIFVQTALDINDGYGAGVTQSRPLSAMSTSTPYYLGIFLQGKIGATLSLKLPIYQNSSTSEYSFDDSLGERYELSLYGYFEMDFVIEADDVVATASNGSFIAGYNATCVYQSGSFDTVEIYTEIALPLPEDSVFWYFVEDPSSSDEDEDEL